MASYYPYVNDTITTAYRDANGNVVYVDELGDDGNYTTENHNDDTGHGSSNTAPPVTPWQDYAANKPIYPDVANKYAARGLDYPFGDLTNPAASQSPATNKGPALNNALPGSNTGDTGNNSFAGNTQGSNTRRNGRAAADNNAYKDNVHVWEYDANGNLQHEYYRPRTAADDGDLRGEIIKHPPAAADNNRAHAAEPAGSSQPAAHSDCDCGGHGADFAGNPAADKKATTDYGPATSLPYPPAHEHYTAEGDFFKDEEPVGRHEPEFRTFTPGSV